MKRDKEYFRKKWEDLLFSGKPIDEEKATEGIKWTYKLSGFEEPAVIFTQSPLAAILLTNILGVYRHNKKDLSADRFNNEIKPVERTFTETEICLLKDIERQLKYINKVKYTEDFKIEDAQKILSGLNVNNIVQISFSYYGNIWDYGWLAYNEYKGETNKNFVKFKELMETGIMDMIRLEDYCIACALPTTIKIQRERLHCADGPAIKWRDNSRLYFWHGTCVKENWILKKVTREELLEIKNAESRRILFEILGAEKFLDLLDVKEIDRDTEHDEELVLYRTKNKDRLAEDYLYFLKVICPSTQRVYVHCVEGPISNAWEAKAKMWGFKGGDFNPYIET